MGTVTVNVEVIEPPEGRVTVLGLMVALIPPPTDVERVTVP